MVFSLPALKCVRDSFPSATIASVARPSAKEILEASGLVDAVMPRHTGIDSRKFGLIRNLRAGQFDLALVFSQSAECAVLARLSGAGDRLGFINTSLGFLLTRRVEFHHPPSTENNLRLVEAAGCGITRRDYFGLLTPTAQQMQSADALLQEHGVRPGETVAAFAPGTSGRRSVKEWTDEGFAEVGAHLDALGVRVVILGTQPSPEIVRESSAVVDLSGKTSLGVAMAILHRCVVVVAVDSGILHLAGAVGTRVVGLYGPSNHLITGPQGEGHVVVTSGVDCSPCIRTECKIERKCMKNLGAQQVIEAVERVIG